MPKTNFKSIRISLFILTLLIFIPLFAIILYSSHLQKAKSYKFATENTLDLARHISDQQELIEENTRQFLVVLSQLPEIYNTKDTGKLNTLLYSLLVQNPIYASLLIVNVKGEVIASGEPYKKLNVSDRKYFRDAIAFKSFSVGEFTRGRLSQKAVLHYAFPVLDKAGDISSIIVASFDLSYYDKFIATTRQDGGEAVYIITDCRDMILYHSPDRQLRIGEKSFLGSITSSDTSSERTFTAEGPDGDRRLFAYRRLSGINHSAYLTIYVGIPESIAFAEYHKILFHNILIWLIALVLILGSAYFYSFRYIIKPIDHLVQIAGSIANGNLQVKTGMLRSSSELSELSTAFDYMAEKLLQRDEEQHKVEKDLKKLKERFELAINSAKIGIWDWHIRTDSLIWDKNMFELYGIPHEQFDGNFASWKGHVFHEDLPDFENNIAGALELHQPFRGEFRIIHPKTGVKSIRIFASVIEDKEGNPARLIGVNWDISERKILENKLNEAKERAERNDRLKSVFFADISHEIRTPLHGIIGFAQILKSHDISYQERLQYLDIIVNNGNKLLNVISNIIDISLIDAGQLKLMKKDCDVRALLYEIYEYYEKCRIKDKKLFQLKLAMDSEAPIILPMDSFRFNQVFYNLLDNVCKYNECGEIHLGCKVTGDELCCFIKDYGTGLNEKQLIRIFDRFRKNDDVEDTKYGENGLGLIICKGLVELMGGTIWANCSETTTEFFFNIPLHQEMTFQNHLYKSDLIV